MNKIRDDIHVMVYNTDEPCNMESYLTIGNDSEGNPRMKLCKDLFQDLSIGATYESLVELRDGLNEILGTDSFTKELQQQLALYYSKIQGHTYTANMIFEIVKNHFNQSL